jgi:hypothetical protein
MHAVLHSHARLAAGHLDKAHQLQESERQGASHQQQQQRWGIHPFYVPDARPDQPSLPSSSTGPQSSTSSSSGSKPVTGAPGDVFELSAPTAGRNAFRVLRSLSLRKAVLLEGSPGVGKTALVAALAKRAGEAVCECSHCRCGVVWQHRFTLSTTESCNPTSCMLCGVLYHILAHRRRGVSASLTQQLGHLKHVCTAVCNVCLQCISSHCRCAAGAHQPVRADRHDGPSGS